VLVPVLVLVLGGRSWVTDQHMSGDGGSTHPRSWSPV